MSTQPLSGSYSFISKIMITSLFLIAVLSAPFLLLNSNAQAAACTVPTTDYGTATMTTSLPGTSTYRIWTRMFVPDTTNNTYLLQIDGNTCFNVGGSGVSSGSWVWVSHQNGSLSSKTDLGLTTGNHNVKLIGNKPGVKIDRVVFTSDLACVPTGFGDNCNTPSDTTAPSVKVTSPAVGANVSGSTVTVSATATDNVAVSKVDFFINGVSIGSDTSAPYSVVWDSSKVANGDHQVSARGYDTSGNASTDSIIVKASNGDTLAPTTPTGLLAEASSHDKVRVTWAASSDNTGIAGYRVYRNGTPIASLGAVTSLDDTTVSASTTYSYKVEAFDAAGNRSALSTSATVTTPGAPVADTEAPSQPNDLALVSVSQSQINLKWSSSTDDVGVVRYDIFRANGSDVRKIGSASSTSYGDTGLNASTTYTYQVAAVDAAGNVSALSTAASLATQAIPSEEEHGHNVTGTVTNKSGARLSGVRVYVSSGDGSTHIVQTNKKGRYAIIGLMDGTYTLSVQKKGYTTQQLTVLMKGADQVKNITLSKR